MDERQMNPVDQNTSPITTAIGCNTSGGGDKDRRASQSATGQQAATMIPEQSVLPASPASTPPQRSKWWAATAVVGGGLVPYHCSASSRVAWIWLGGRCCRLLCCWNADRCDGGRLVVRLGSGCRSSGCGLGHRLSYIVW
jgi:hypothetical protein